MVADPSWRRRHGRRLQEPRAAIDRNAWRHPIRFVRLRLDVTVADVAGFGQRATPAAR
ncbi:hypothetical protein [Streptomyces sp. CB03238]|uniref:hypothetical protein n=1 Tax=Streptomyces sp. CB03238 TaxID=1907777 RepID=UPI0015C4509E|nr:hypothetical protein [Streptomyces sp. CB03238]